MEKINLSIEERKMVQKIELNILAELDRICRKHNINYTLAYGTLLGAIRHNGFIPWDDDVDVCMLRRDYEKFRKVCEEELDKKYFYQTNETDSEYYHLFDKIRANDTVFKESFLEKYHIHHGVYIDIFPLDYVPDSSIKRMLQYCKFHFYRLGLMSKYMMISARSGKKKCAAIILKFLYKPFPLKKLYDGACDAASKYKNKAETNVQSFYSPYKRKDIFDRRYFEEYIEVRYEEYKFFVIKNYDIILSRLYNDYMEYPPEEQRITRHDLVELKL